MFFVLLTLLCHVTVVARSPVVSCLFPPPAGLNMFLQRPAQSYYPQVSGCLFWQENFAGTSSLHGDQRLVIMQQNVITDQGWY